MLKIRKEQMDAFSSPMGEQFEDALVAFLREEFLDARAESPATLEPGVREQIERARSYGLQSGAHIATYVVTAWLLGQEFDTKFPAARDTLNSTLHSPDDKAEWLADWTERLFLELERK